MKRLFALFLVLVMVFSLAACGKKPLDSQPDDTSSSDVTGDTGIDTDKKPGVNGTDQPDNNGEHTCQFGEWTTTQKAFGVLTLTRKVDRTCTVCGKTEAARFYEAQWDVFDQLFSKVEDSICIDRYFEVASATDGPFSIQGLFAAGDFLVTEPHAMDAGEDPIVVSAGDYYAKLQEYFVLSDSIIAQMKQERPGDSYELYFNYNGSSLMPYSCIYLRDNIYAIYYTYGHSGCTFMPQFRAEVEYNQQTGKCKFLSLTTDGVVSYDMERTTGKSVTLDDFVIGATGKATTIPGLYADPIAATPSEVTKYYELFQAMDIFGYNLTEEEVFGKGWGWLNIEAEGEVLKSVTMYTDLPVFDWMEDTKPSVIAAAKRDIDKFVKLIGDNSNIYTRIGKQGAEGVQGTETITDEALDNVIGNWMGDESICVYTNEPVTIGGYNYNLALSILSPGGMHEQAYDISLTFTLAY